MNKQTLAKFVKPFKPVLSRTVWREGTVAKVLFGPCKGLRYRVFPDMGLSPIYGGWETEAQDLMVEHIRPGFVVYDVGGNYGIHTLLMARLAGSAGHVYSFEPVPGILEELRGNVSLNGFSNVTCVGLAIDERTGTASFYTADHVGAGHLAEAGKANGDMLTVETVTLDEFVFDRNNRPPDFIKVDVEGAESKVLGGGEGVLEKYRPILLIDLHTPEQDVAVGRSLLKYGYKAYRTDSGEQVQRLDKGWPEPGGLWGQFIAFAGS